MSDQAQNMTLSSTLSAENLINALRGDNRYDVKVQENEVWIALKNSPEDFVFQPMLRVRINQAPGTQTDMEVWFESRSSERTKNTTALIIIFFVEPIFIFLMCSLIPVKSNDLPPGIVLVFFWLCLVPFQLKAFSDEKSKGANVHPEMNQELLDFLCKKAHLPRQLLPPSVPG